MGLKSFFVVIENLFYQERGQDVHSSSLIWLKQPTV